MKPTCWIRAILLFPAILPAIAASAALPAGSQLTYGTTGIHADFSYGSNPQATTIPSDTLRPAPDTTGVSSDAASIQSDTTETRFNVFPLTMESFPGATETETDSTLRWSQWLEWSDKLARQPGVLPYRQGGFNRTDFFLIDGLPLNRQELYVEGMRTHNAVTENPMYAHLSLERLISARQSTSGLSHRTDIEWHRIYLRRPRTRVRYEQSSFDLRSTEVQLSQMATHRLGLELMYHGKNFAGEYPRALTESRQMSARAWFHLSERYMAQTMILYNGVQANESGGYVIPDLASFNFSRFFTSAIDPSGSSSVRHTQIQVALMRREAARTDSVQSRRADTRLLLYYDRYRRSYARTGVFSSFRYQGIHAAVQHKVPFRFLPLRGEVRGSYYHLIPSQNPSLNVGGWSHFFTDLRGQIRLPGIDPSRLHLPVTLQAAYRGDGAASGQAGLGAEIMPFGGLRIFGQVFTGLVAPTIQQRYWTGTINGNPQLDSYRQQRLEAGVTVQPGDGPVTLQARGYVHQHERMVVLRADSMFAGVPDVNQWGGVVEFNWNHPSWEVHASATFQQYRSENLSLEAQLLDGSGLRIRNQASVYWKGYVLDNAAYVKTGFYGVLSPNFYRAAAWIPQADYWEPARQTDEVPAYARLDFDLTARVRTLMVLFRWENIAQGLGQAGYYEASPFPMPSRRIRFGLRVYFTN